MAADWQRRMDVWLEAGVIDKETAARILRFEGQDGRALRSSWPVVLLFGLGALLVGAGVLLFISAHWDALSPLRRMSLVITLVAGFHLAGAWFASRIDALATTCHALGTIALGAGILLTGQIFNLAERWPAGMLLWAAGAAAGYGLLRNWPQLSLTAILAPGWLAGEFVVRYEREVPDIVFSFLLVLAFSYLTAVWPERVSDERRMLCALGSVAVLPLGILAAAVPLMTHRVLPPADLSILVISVLAFLLPLGVALALRGKRMWMNAVAAIWVAVLAMLTHGYWTLAVHAWCALGAVGLIAWGIHELRSERINLGVAAFAITVLFFYFSSVMDKLGRSASLITLGILFLAGGWGLERGRRGLIARIRGGRP